MAKIYLIRHGQAAAGWNEDLDPPLSDTGNQQAMKVAQSLLSIPDVDNFLCLSSPIKRAYQTAEHFAELAGKEIVIEKRVAEIPSPIEDVQERMPWLMSVMRDSWPNLSPALNQWRTELIDFTRSLDKDSLIFSHYIAINVLIGHCQNNQQVISYNPDNCSVHQFTNTPELNIIELGHQANTKIN